MKLKLVIFIFFVIVAAVLIFRSTILSALLVTNPDGTSVHTINITEQERARESQKDKVAKEQTSNDAYTVNKRNKPLLVTTRRQICMQNIFDGGYKSTYHQIVHTQHTYTVHTD